MHSTHLRHKHIHGALLGAAVGDALGLARKGLTRRSAIRLNGSRPLKYELLPRRGISVISDIDDTIKVSHVANRGRLLRNTFVNPFAPVPGMAELYQAWREAGAA